MLPIVNPGPAPCKICGAAAPLMGVVDFHKSCLQREGKTLPMSGIPIYYRRCPQCSFVFTDAFDDWSPGAFARRLYNADYAVVDPEYAEDRPATSVKAFEALFPKPPGGTRVLDYGGGSGKFAELLAKQTGVSVTSYDPFAAPSRQPSGTYEVVTCFEVLEHAVQPAESVAALVGLVARDGVLLMTTLLQNADFAANGLGWWYIAPRNGHISIHSPASLALLFKKVGFTVVTISGYHLAFKAISPLIAHLVKKVPAEAAKKKA